ncbi:MAG TPA: N-acetylglucosamine-6-phosphate deacetylase [Vicinamibacterales bacterium]|nr:N-acetylglucosamine-6-phosphate deacetylase [Vicinamibacterales bacterium]
MIILSGGDLVLPDRIVTGGSLVLDGSRIAAVESNARVDTAGAEVVDARQCYVVPGFIDVHVHGLDGIDLFDRDAAVAEMAGRMPAFGVTAFCPTSIACDPAALRGFLAAVGRARLAPSARVARVLPAHLESNFLNPEYAGAQPLECLRVPADLDARSTPLAPGAETTFSGREILDVIATCRADVGIVTVAPELEGGIDLVRTLCADGHRVSLGHSGADFDQAMAAFDAGARHATHLFNRMPALAHRAPGLPGAALAREDVVAELICDGHHVHPAMCRLAMSAKGPRGILAITDGTAGAGLPVGSSARLGPRTIRVGPYAAELENGTLAGSTLTMDRAFANVVNLFGGSLVDAALMCATNPARALGLAGHGVIAEGAPADLAVLDRNFRVVRTFVGGVQAWGPPGGGQSWGPPSGGPSEIRS